MKPLIELGDFKRLDLQFGTVQEVHQLESLDLVAVDVQASERVSALLSVGAAAEVRPGSRVVVAVGLHPLTVRGSAYAALVVAAPIAGVEASDGSRVS